MRYVEDDVDEVVAYLNELVSLDRDAMEHLIETRVRCNDKIVEHPTVQVMKGEDGNMTVGLLGILNGLVGTQPDESSKPGWGFIAASYDDGKLVKFVRIDR
jgi:hypothetical protein